MVSPTTKLILEGIFAFILIGVLIWMFIKIYGGTSSNNGTTCWPGTKYSEKFGGCITCDGDPSVITACRKCSNNTECNGGTCAPVTQGGKGVCLCPKGFFGTNCEKECDDKVPCKTGKCQNGRCVKTTCECSNGKSCSAGDTSCRVCAPNRGPKFPECSRKLFQNEPIKVGTSGCWDPSIHSKETLNKHCIDEYGSTASYAGLCTGSKDGCSGFFDDTDELICNVKSYWAYPSFEPKNFKACFDNYKKSADVFKAAGGLKY
jgi:hypothetical protein